MYHRKKMNKGKEVLGKAMRIITAVDTGGMSEVVGAARNVMGPPGQARRAARKDKRAKRRAARQSKMGGGRVMYAHGSMVNAMPKAKPC